MYHFLIQRLLVDNLCLSKILQKFGAHLLWKALQVLLCKRSNITEQLLRLSNTTITQLICNYHTHPSSQ
uniref:Uncharacterized protein n=1 Tax=Manihot esculenta TaxID=3983 RepID=A0A2C9UTI8_MANES